MPRSDSERRQEPARKVAASAKARRKPVATAQAPTGIAEPELVMLLSEPEVRLVMRADHVDERELLASFNAISVKLRRRSERARSTRVLDHSKYRPGVGIVLLNDRGEIFVARRNDVKGEAWQMPQGGMRDGESPREAALRELKEEIGTDNVGIIAESRSWLYYDVPPGLARKAWQSRWRGQRQKWFVMAFKGRDAEIDLATDEPEFDAWRWIPPFELSALAVSFKRKLYDSVLGEFSTVFRD